MRDITARLKEDMATVAIEAARTIDALREQVRVLNEGNLELARSNSNLRNQLEALRKKMDTSSDAEKRVVRMFQRALKQEQKK